MLTKEQRDTDVVAIKESLHKAVTSLVAAYRAGDKKALLKARKHVEGVLIGAYYALLEHAMFDEKERSGE